MLTRLVRQNPLRRDVQISVYPCLLFRSELLLHEVDGVGWTTGAIYGVVVPCFLAFLLFKQRRVMRPPGSSRFRACKFRVQGVQGPPQKP